MKRSLLFWILSILATVALSYYQRVTGPTYPVDGTVLLEGKEIRFSFDRTFESGKDQPVAVAAGDARMSGTLHWRRFKSGDPWTDVPMRFAGGRLVAELPSQPSAGKLEYYVTLAAEGETRALPEHGTVVTRFKGFVPLFILVPHVVVIFLALILSMRTGLEAFRAEPRYTKLLWWTLGLLILGGMILGPIVQKYAFGAYWTGVPFGYDLTDNKTLIALLGWAAAAVQIYRKPNPKWWVVGAAAVMLIIFFIPHSLLGSEIDYSKLPRR